MEPLVACTLEAGEQSIRSKRWVRLGARASATRTPTERGLELTFGAGPGVETELLELVELERECCAFAEWEVSTAHGKFVLDVRAKGPEAVAAVQEMFRALGS